MGKWLCVICCLLLMFSVVTCSKYNKLLEQYSREVVNVKAFEAENADLKTKNVLFQLTARELQYSHDSLFTKFDSVRALLKIRTNKLAQMGYIESSVSVTDTIHLHDTLFVNDFQLDTILSDVWHKTHITLTYPNYISVQNQVKSNKYIVLSSRKETINPPRRFFLFRWFLKKHNVITVDVVEENPLITTDKTRFVEIVK